MIARNPHLTRLTHATHATHPIHLAHLAASTGAARGHHRSTLPEDSCAAHGPAVRR